MSRRTSFFDYVRRSIAAWGGPQVLDLPDQLDPAEVETVALIVSFDSRFLVVSLAGGQSCVVEVRSSSVERLLEFLSQIPAENRRPEVNRFLQTYNRH